MPVTPDPPPEPRGNEVADTLAVKGAKGEVSNSCINGDDRKTVRLDGDLLPLQPRTGTTGKLRISLKQHKSHSQLSTSKLPSNQRTHGKMPEHLGPITGDGTS